MEKKSRTGQYQPHNLEQILGKNFILEGVVKHWNRLLGQWWKCHHAWECGCGTCGRGGGAGRDLESLFQPQWSYDFRIIWLLNGFWWNLFPLSAENNRERQRPKGCEHQPPHKHQRPHRDGKISVQLGADVRTCSGSLLAPAQGDPNPQHSICGSGPNDFHSSLTTPFFCLRNTT